MSAPGWRERRHRNHGKRVASPVPQDLLAGSGRTFGPTSWVTVTQHEVNQFAEATRDFQSIHTDAERAKDGPFGWAIALASGFVPQLIAVEKCSAVLSYGGDRVRLPAAVPVPSKCKGTRGGRRDPRNGRPRPGDVAHSGGARGCRATALLYDLSCANWSDRRLLVWPGGDPAVRRC